MALFRISSEQVRMRIVSAVMEAPIGHTVRISEPPRSLEQNALLHALLTEIADSEEWAGQKWDVETWKRLLIAAWSRAERRSIPALPALDGHGVDIVYKPSSSLTRSEMTSLIDYIQAWRAGGAT
jgi:hypothetical protein